MAFDTATRNRLATFVREARTLIAEEFTQKFQAIYGISPSGEITPLERLSHLDEAGRATAALLRERITYLIASYPAEKDGAAAAVKRLAREQSFTVLNRLAAIRMAEKRKLIVESVGKGYQSAGYRVYEQIAFTGLGDTYHRYRFYLFCLFDELAVDLGVLFDRHSAASLLFPREPALLRLLALLNARELDALWAEDETIGWIYQYFNDEAERKKMREESSAPRNSRELAVRNQFFTPRYVVEFLTDNTLGRLWYEMTHGETALRDRCRYLVRRPTEIFLKEGESGEEKTVASGPKAEEHLSQEDLLKQPVSIPYRPLKDPRTIRVLDPACGSMHFGLYAFDLFECIYDEAWEMAVRMKAESREPDPAFSSFIIWHSSFPSKEDFLREVPRLIVEHNLHGIDIDPRAAQIAGLSLWLRAQRSWLQAGVETADRPRITRSNLVCAEPMPGDAAQLRAFVHEQFPVAEQPAFTFLLETIFDCMSLAGEAGSLLRIEEEIRTAIANAKRLWKEGPKAEQALMFSEPGKKAGQGEMRLDLSGITDDQFWEQAERRIYEALEAYSEQAETGGTFQRRLFADDAAQGFAFIDLCTKRYDVAVMNPPFGDASLPSKSYIDQTYGDTKGDVYKAFVECFHGRLVPAGYLGIISSRTGFFLGQSEDWRTRVVLRLFRPIALADLGSGVLDAMVEVAAYVLRSLSAPEARDLTLSIVPVLEKVVRDSQDRFSLPKWQAARGGLKRHQAVAELEHLEAHGFVQRSSGDTVRYTPLWDSVKKVAAPPEPVFPPLVCVRALAEADKGMTIASAIANPDSHAAFVCDPAEFRKVPATSFAYWVSSRVRGMFKTLPQFESEGRTVRQGMATANDDRFLRIWFEVPAGVCLNARGADTAGEDEFHAWCVEQSRATTRWFPFAKGGAFAPFYQDLSLMGNWHNDGAEIRNFCDLTTGKVRSRPQSTDYYFRPGYTYPLRTSRLCPQVLPAGSLISVRGSGIYGDRSGAFLAVLNSLPFDFLIKMILGRFGHPQFDMGDINLTPIPRLSAAELEHFAELAMRCVGEKRDVDTANSTSHAFSSPALLAISGSTLAERAAAWAARVRTSEETVAAIQAEIDDLAFRLYGLDAADRAALTSTLATEAIGDADAEPGEDEEEEAATADASALAADLLAYALGCAFGRWDIRYATGERPAPPAPDPFAPLPVCPPGMLQGDDGLPLSPAAGSQLRAAGHYPLDVTWNGILVDDPEHPLDLERRVHAALTVLWGDRAEAIEHEACTLLGVKSLRDFFRKPAGFFADHLKRYSKSRRQAPIYWPLSTASGSYTLWIYYHRLNDQTLHTCLADFVDPKIRSVQSQIRGLKDDNGPSTKLEEIQELEAELTTLRTELDRIIRLPWKPNLNDGVLITASSLWSLFRLGKWQKDLKACWKALEEGDYDWAHLAHTIWPDRVRQKCKHDRSLAIAHGLESLCEIEAPKPKAKKAKKAKAEETPELS